MTFLCTVAGELVPGTWDNAKRNAGGDILQDWPEPWSVRCNGCGYVTEYGRLFAAGNGVDLCITCRTGKPDQLRLA